MAYRRAGSEKPERLARPEVRRAAALGHLCRAGHRRVVEHLRRDLDYARHHPHLPAVSGLVLGAGRRVLSHAVRPLTVGTGLQRCRDEIHDIHHQAPRRVLHV